jgi:5-(carboxyamino)imidazole ribonucleotide synthase
MRITPPATLGILGGGQLGRYFVMAARTMGYRTMVLEPDPNAPAGKTPSALTAAKTSAVSSLTFFTLGTPPLVVEPGR